MKLGLSPAWFAEDNKGRRHEAIWEIVERIRRAQEYRRVNDLLHASLYGNVQLLGLTPGNYSKPAAGAHARLSLNVVRNMTAAAVAKLFAKNKIKPTFTTVNGDASLREKAQGLEDFSLGVFYDNRTHRMQRRQGIDTCVFGDGLIEVYPDFEAKRVRHQRVLPWEMFVDDAEAIYGDPRCIYRRRYVDRQQLLKRFPDKQQIIEDAKPDEGEWNNAPDRTCDYVPVVTAHHLPSLEVEDLDSEDHDGLITMCTSAGVLFDKPYPYPTFNYVNMRWSEDPAGWHGVGLAAELAGIQAEINDLLEEIQRAHRLIKGHWLVEKGSQVILNHINDDLAAIVKYVGVAPQYHAPVAIAADVYQHLWNLYEKAYEIAGINQLAAQSQKPAGLNSGVALRNYADLQTERLLTQGMELEDATVELTELSLRAARELAKHGEVRIKAKTGDGMRKINFSDIDMRRDDYLLQAFPTSMLPATPEGKWAMVQDWINTKFVSAEDGFELLDFPDTRGFAKRKLAPRKIIERNIAMIRDEGKWVPPEPLDNHELALRLVPEAIDEARLDGVHPKRVNMMRKYVTLTEKHMARRAAAQGGAVGAPGGAPPAPPMTPGAPPGAPPALPPGAPPPDMEAA